MGLNLHPSEIAKYEAEARQRDAEARLRNAEADRAEVLLSVARLEAIVIEESDRQRRATDFHNRVYRFAEEIDEETSQRAIARLASWHRMDPSCAIEFVITSPGGSIVDGLALFDFLRWLSNEGHVLTTRSLGMAASMGGVLLQAGDRRVMSPGASLLIHEGSMVAWGASGQVEDTVDWVKTLQERILDIFAQRSKLSKVQLRRKWSRKDWWLNADEALRYGLIDEIA